MKIKKLKLKNFRCFHDEVEINFDNFTAFVGKNDVGKSSLLEALDIFFNDSSAISKLEQEDLNVDARDCEEKDNEISITVCFSDLPKIITIDQTNIRIYTKCLLNIDGELEILKKYKISNSSTTTSIQPRIFLCNCYPIVWDYTKGAPVPRIHKDYINKSLQYNKVIEIKSVKTEPKPFGNLEPIWKTLQIYMPLYSLFQADRKNTDSDSEVQDPLKEAVKEILSDNNLQQKLNEVAATVEAKLKDVANRTLAKLRKMDPTIAKTLKPVIPPVNTLKWQDIFRNVSIASDENIPVNKHGSGIKRLILLSFFRAEVERRQHETNLPNVIYAIEEPEISQYYENQKKLIDALTQLAETAGVQVIITTHSPTVVKNLNFTNIRVVSKDNEGARKVINTPPQILPYPSLNEVNYIAFSEISEGYHDELYSYINEQENWIKQYNSTQKKKGNKKNYIKEYIDKETQEKKTLSPKGLSLSEYIRHRIHHPENKHNNRFTDTELRTSIEEMRKFIQAQNSKTAQQEW